MIVTAAVAASTARTLVAREGLAASVLGACEWASMVEPTSIVVDSAKDGELVANLLRWGGFRVLYVEGA